MPRVLFTGGGSAGHVTPNVALIEQMLSDGWEVQYVGSVNGIEYDIISPLGIRFDSIQTGKLRRYFDWRNFTDPLRIIAGFFQALAICLRFRPDVVFSKGGFVAVPVVVAAWCLRCPIICHESDMTPGLANRLCLPLARRICVNFSQTAASLPKRKVVVTGTPVRRVLTQGSKAHGLATLGFTADKPVLLAFGGSLGAASINRVLREALPRLTERFNIAHIAGAGAIDESLIETPGYFQAEFLNVGFGDVLAAADIVISRAGANSLYELLVMAKPHLLIPLPLSASRGDQIENARAFEALGMSRVLDQAELSADSLDLAISALFECRDEIAARLRKFEHIDSVRVITDLIKSFA